MNKRINIAVIGDLDHGKSTLIGRLLYEAQAIPEKTIREVVKINRGELEFSLLLDSFREERYAELTLDTTQALIRMKRFELNFIDCPGHREFIQNMLTGASQADLAILVVSAKEDEGVGEQTRMHINLARLLGIKRLIVAINKMDSVDYERRRFLELKNELEKYLKKVNYRRKVPFVPLSAKQGENLIKKSYIMRWYKYGPLLEILNNQIKGLNSCKGKNYLRIIVQGFYKYGSDSILLGKVERGRVKVNDFIFMSLSKQKGKVVKIVKGNRNKKFSREGECIGFIVEGINMDKVKRGEVITGLNSKLRPIEKIKADVFFLKRRPKGNAKFIIKCGLREAGCKLKVLNFKDGIYKVNLFLEEPLVVESDERTPILGRFILMDKRANILGLGRIDA